MNFYFIFRPATPSGARTTILSSGHLTSLNRRSRSVSGTTSGFLSDDPLDKSSASKSPAYVDDGIIDKIRACARELMTKITLSEKERSVKNGFFTLQILTFR